MVVVQLVITGCFVFLLFSLLLFEKVNHDSVFLLYVYIIYNCICHPPRLILEPEYVTIKDIQNVSSPRERVICTNLTVRSLNVIMFYKDVKYILLV